MGLELTINLDLTIFSRETKRIVKSRSYCTNITNVITIIIVNRSISRITEIEHK